MWGVHLHASSAALTSSRRTLAIPAPVIIPRTRWHAAAPKYRVKTSWDVADVLWLHHSAGAEPKSTGTALETIRGIQRYHTTDPEHLWADIGYNYLVDFNGQIYEGRGFEVVGAHTGPSHNDEPGVCLLGTYATHEPSPAQRASVWLLADWLNVADVSGHRDAMSTDCPGDAAYEYIVLAPPMEHELPYSNTLRLSLHGITHAGWAKCSDRLRSIAAGGLKPAARARIAWRGDLWPKDARLVGTPEGTRQAVLVAQTLVNRFL